MPALPDEDWQARYFAVIDPRLEAYREEGVPFEGSKEVLDYLEANRGLLAGRPQSQHHGDYHVENMVVGPEGRLAVIDWAEADFDNCGDPWYEFNRLETKLPAFATGQADGYFPEGVPENFWLLLNYYLAAGAITSIVWAKYFAPECMEEIMERNRDIGRRMNGKTRLIPDWYDGSLKQKES